MFKLVFLALAISANALPGGAPRCAINATAIAAAHAKPSDNGLGYGLDVRMADAGSWDVRVTNGAGRKAFQGILMYVNSDAAPKAHLGKFQFDAQNFKAQATNICNAINVTGAPEATITHANAGKKMLQTTAFKWAPGQDDAKAPGTIWLNVVIADNDGDDVKTTKPRWVALPPMKLDLLKMVNNNNNQNNNTCQCPPVQAPQKFPEMREPLVRKVIKCKPRAHMYGGYQTRRESRPSRGGGGYSYGYRARDGYEY